MAGFALNTPNIAWVRLAFSCSVQTVVVVVVVGGGGGGGGGGV